MQRDGVLISISVLCSRGLLVCHRLTCPCWRGTGLTRSQRKGGRLLTEVLKPLRHTRQTRKVPLCLSVGLYSCCSVYCALDGAIVKRDIHRHQRCIMGNLRPSLSMHLVQWVGARRYLAPPPQHFQPCGKSCMQTFLTPYL